MSDITFGSNLIEFGGRQKNPVPFLKRVGAMMKGRVARTFASQGRDGIEWRARKVPNVIGIIKDMEAGRKSIPNRRFEYRPAARDTGLLARSISFQVEGNTAVSIGTVVQYANKVQGGGVSVARINMVARNNLSDVVARARARVAKGTATRKDEMISDLGYLLFASQVKVNVPPRPFVYFSPKDRGDIFQMARDYFGKPGSAAVAKP